jgi:GntR family transcriptional regulator
MTTKYSHHDDMEPLPNGGPPDEATPLMTAELGDGQRIPKYEHVKDVILGRIDRGVWAVEKPIPPEPELCDEFAVSRTTIRKAIGDLVYAGRLRTVQGSGTFVADRKVQEHFIQRGFGIHEDMRRRGLRLTTDVLRQEVIAAPADVVTPLRVAIGEPVHVIVRVRSVEGERILVSTTYIPEVLCPGLVDDDLASGSLYRLLAERYGLAIASGTRHIEAVGAGQWEARRLDVALGTPLLLLDSVAYLRDGRPFEFSQALQRGDRARIEVEFLPETEEPG